MTAFTCLFRRAILYRVRQANTNSSSCSSLLPEQNCRTYINMTLKHLEREREEGKGRVIHYIQVEQVTSYQY